MAEELKLIFKVDKDGMVSVEQLEKKMGRVDAQVKRGNKGLGEMSSLLKTSMVVTGANQAIQLFQQFGAAAAWAFNQIEQGVEANRAQAYFQSMAEYAGRAGADVQAALKKVTLGELTETQTQQAFNTLIEVTQDVEASIAGVGLAFEYAQRTGKGFERAVQGVMSVMATGEATTAAKFGLFLDTTTLLEKAAKAAGVDVELLTGAQKRAAIQAEVTAQAQAKIAKGTFGVGNAAMQAAAAMKDMQSAMQQMFAGGAPKGMSAMFGEVFAIDDLSEQLKEFTMRTSTFREEEARLSDKAAEATRLYYASMEGGDFWIGMSDDMDAANEALAKFRKEGAGGMQELSANLKKVTDDTDEFLGIVGKMSFASQVMNGGIENMLASRHEMLEGLLRQLDDAAQPGAEATKEQEALRARLGAVTDALRVQGEARGLLADATVSDIQIMKEELAALTANGKAAEERGAFLSAMIPILEKVNAQEVALFKTLSAAPDSGKIDMLKNMGLSGEALTEAARGLARIEERRKELDVAMKSGTDEGQAVALDNLALAGDRFVGTLREANVAEHFLATTTDGLNRSMAGYSLSVGVAEGKTRGLKAAMVEMLAPYAAGLDKALDAGKLLSAELSRRAEQARAEAERAKQLGQERQRQAATDKATLAELADRYAVLTEEITPYQAVQREIARTTYSTNALMDEEIRLMHRKLAAQTEEKRQADELAASQPGGQGAADISGLIQEAQTLAALRFEYFELTGAMSALDVERKKIAAMPEDTAMQAAIKGAREQILWEKERQQALMDSAAAMSAMADATRESGRAFADAASNVSMWDGAFGETETLSQRSKLLFDNISGMGDAIGNVMEASGQSMESQAQAASGALTMMSSTMAGLMPGVAEAAWLMAGLAAANALFLSFMFPQQAAQQATAAVAYTALALMAGGKSSGKSAAGGSVARSMGTSTPTAQTGAGGSYTVYMGNNNVYAEDGPQVGEKLIKHLRAAQYSGAKIPAGMMQ